MYHTCYLLKQANTLKFQGGTNDEVVCLLTQARQSQPVVCCFYGTGKVMGTR